jgi:fructose/tagatose bisphosphate aldolase
LPLFGIANGENTNAVLEIAHGENTNAVLEIAHGESTNAVLEIAYGESTNAVLGAGAEVDSDILVASAFASAFDQAEMNLRAVGAVGSA